MLIIRAAFNVLAFLSQFVEMLLQLFYSVYCSFPPGRGELRTPPYLWWALTNPSPNKFNSIININRSQTKLCKFKKYIFIIFTSQRFGACPFFKDGYTRINISITNIITIHINQNPLRLIPLVQTYLICIPKKPPFVLAYQH